MRNGADKTTTIRILATLLALAAAPPACSADVREAAAVRKLVSLDPIEEP